MTSAGLHNLLDFVSHHFLTSVFLGHAQRHKRGHRLPKRFLLRAFANQGELRKTFLSLLRVHG
jgi:hypothetical protein